MTSPAEQNLYAAIDLGSNSFHMIIAREVHGKMQIIDKHKEMVRLRSGLDAKGNLHVEAFDRGIACLERFGQLIKGIPASQVRAVGTNTLRNAKNSAQFLKAAKKALGVPVNIIAGQEEARLIYLGVSHGLPQSEERRLVMDIGGGSTEYIIGKHFSNDHLTSTEMGCVSISQAFFKDQKIDEKDLNKAISRCQQILRPHSQTLLKLGWDVALGASGSIKSIGAILEENGWSENGITAKGMQKLADKLIDAGEVSKAKIKGLKEEREPVLLGGLAILIATFRELNIETMQVSSNALREGLIFDTLGRLHAEDARETSILALQNWMKVDKEQAQQVANTALCLYKQTHNIWQLHNADFDLRKLLIWAAKVHEVGFALSYKRYRHHSAYILANADMAGFSQQEQSILSIMMLNHRGKFQTDPFKDLEATLAEQIQRLCILLRLSVRIHRGRENEALTPEIIIQKSHQVHLEFPPHWLESHPLTQLDLTSEANNLSILDIDLTFA